MLRLRDNAADVAVEAARQPVLGAGGSNRTVIHQLVSGRHYTRGSSQNRAAGRAVRAAPVSRFGTGRCDFGRIHSSVPGRRKDGPLLQNLTAYGTSDIVRNTRLGTGRRFSRLNSREVSRCGRDDLPADQADLRFRAGRIRTEGVPRGRRDSGLCQNLPADRAGGAARVPVLRAGWLLRRDGSRRVREFVRQMRTAYRAVYLLRAGCFSVRVMSGSGQFGLCGQHGAADRANSPVRQPRLGTGGQFSGHSLGLMPGCRNLRRLRQHKPATTATNPGAMPVLRAGGQYGFCFFGQVSQRRNGFLRGQHVAAHSAVRSGSLAVLGTACRNGGILDRGVPGCGNGFGLNVPADGAGVRAFASPRTGGGLQDCPVAVGVQMCGLLAGSRFRLGFRFGIPRLRNAGHLSCDGFRFRGGSGRRGSLPGCPAGRQKHHPTCKHCDSQHKQAKADRQKQAAVGRGAMVHSNSFPCRPCRLHGGCIR